MNNSQNEPFFMGKIIPSLLASSLARVSILVFTVFLTPSLAIAQAQPTMSSGSLTECAFGHPLRARLPQNFEKIPSENPAVLCVFRNKIDGFPTLNIVVEPRLEGATPPSLVEYEEGIKRGYQSVGLSDATLSESGTGESQGVPYFTSEVSFTNAGIAMKARILVLQLHDRTYTVSAVGRAALDLPVLKEFIEGIEVEGRPLNLHRKSDGPLKMMAVGISIAVILLRGRRR
jgi:hypothetical protein